MSDQATWQVDWLHITPERRAKICAFLRAHDIDPNDVPIDVVIHVDARAGEIKLEIFDRGPGGIRVDPLTGEPCRKRIRRLLKGPLP